MRDEVPTAQQSRGIAHFPCFDGLRAVAALSVFTFHFFGIHGPSWLHGNLQALVARLGGQGVAIFFVISGFLLYRPFVDAAIRGVSSPSAGPFWLRRFVRIFPAYWLALTAFVYLFGLVAIHGFENFVTFYGLLENYRGGYALLGLGTAWTLGIELSFYLAVPLIDRVVRALAGTHASPMRVFRVQICAISLLASTALAVRALNIWIVTSSPHGAWFPLHASGYSLFAYLDWFAIGMTFALLSASSAFLQKRPKSVTVLASRPAVTWALACGVFVVQSRVQTTASHTLDRFIFPSLVGLTAALVVFPAVFEDQDGGAIRAFLSTKTMRYLGGISYGIYLWHFIFISLVLRWMANGALPDVLFVRFVAVATFTLVTASASFYLIEKPLITWSQRVSRRRHEIIAVESRR